MLHNPHILVAEGAGGGIRVGRLAPDRILVIRVVH